MLANGHTQKDVETATGVPQPQISRALKGFRKRPTQAMRKLCQYAGIDFGDNRDSPSLAELVELLQNVAAGSPVAAECVKGMLQSLAPLAARASREGTAR